MSRKGSRKLMKEVNMHKGFSRSNNSLDPHWNSLSAKVEETVIIRVLPSLQMKFSIWTIKASLRQVLLGHNLLE